MSSQEANKKRIVVKNIWKGWKGGSGPKAKENVMCCVVSMVPLVLWTVGLNFALQDSIPDHNRGGSTSTATPYHPHSQSTTRHLSSPLEAFIPLLPSPYFSFPFCPHLPLYCACHAHRLIITF